MSIERPKERPKYQPAKDACERCGIRRGVVLTRDTEELLCWVCYRDKQRRKSK